MKQPYTHHVNSTLNTSLYLSHTCPSLFFFLTASLDYLFHFAQNGAQEAWGSRAHNSARALGPFPWGQPGFTVDAPMTQARELLKRENSTATQWLFK